MTLMTQLSGLNITAVKQLKALELQKAREAKEKQDRAIADLREKLVAVDAQYKVPLNHLLDEAHGILLEAKGFLDMSTWANQQAMQSFGTADFKDCWSVLNCFGDFNITLGEAVLDNEEHFKNDSYRKCIDMRRRLEKMYNKWMDARGEFFVAIENLTSSKSVAA